MGTFPQSLHRKKLLCRRILVAVPAFGMNAAFLRPVLGHSSPHTYLWQTSPTGCTIFKHVPNTNNCLESCHWLEAAATTPSLLAARSRKLFVNIHGQWQVSGTWQAMGCQIMFETLEDQPAAWPAAGVAFQNIYVPVSSFKNSFQFPEHICPSMNIIII